MGKEREVYTCFAPSADLGQRWQLKFWPQILLLFVNKLSKLGLL